tara:strand:- start:1422 stop:2360 length:939 start_codon:yes stop_codon:yes gene_type:complete
MKTILISGCAGFIGQNLVASLIDSYRIIGIDNFYSSNKNTIKPFLEHKNFKFLNIDIIELIEIEEKIDIIYNLACPASPPIYQKNPLFTLDTNYMGTKNLLDLAKNNSSIFIQASTSEVYGDPEVNPQSEDYFGNVNTMGIRSCYDEGKRIAETLCYEYRRAYNVETRIIRIFNTYGPGMEINDGRVISNFLVNTIKKKELKVYGDGNQTRSFCFIDDLIRGLVLTINNDFSYPINLGNNYEISLNHLIEILKDKLEVPNVKYLKPVQDDPKIRRPDISRANMILGWVPTISIEDGIDKTYKYFESKLKYEN